MKYVSVIEDKTYLLWQQEIQAINLKLLGLELVIVVLCNGRPSPAALSLSNISETHFFENHNPYKYSYLPSNKPWGLFRLLKDYPQYGEKLFLLDSDVIFKEVIDFTYMDQDDAWYMSDCASYLNYDYLKCYPEPQLTSLIETVTTVAKVRDGFGGGAQYYFKNIDAGFCLKVCSDSDMIYKKINKEKGDSKIQVWTAEMWAWIWNAFNIVTVKTSSELDFCWATDPEIRWHQTKLLHLAGVISKEDGIFYKGNYVDKTPWDDKDYSYITKKDNCGWIYLKKIAEYKGFSLENL